MKKIEIPPSGMVAPLRSKTDSIQTAADIAQLIRQCSKDPELIETLKSLSNINRDQLPEIIGKLAYKSAYFEPDPIGRQYLRTPQRMLRDQRANCVDYTIFIGSIAKCLGLPVVVRIVSFPGLNQYTHVYPIVDGIPVDVVPDQDQTGNEYRTRGNKSCRTIGREAPFVNKFDTLV